MIGAWLQQRSWKQQNWECVRERKIKSALSTVEDAARLFDRRLYRERRLLWAARKGNSNEIEAARSEYQIALFEWMDNLGRIKAELWVSFDQWTATRFEDELHDRLRKVGSRIEAKLQGKLRSALIEEERALNELGRSGYTFIHELLKRIEIENLNGLAGHDDISYENWNNLTSGYLIRRLLGLPA